MAKPFINVKRKPKDGTMLTEVWNDGSAHEVKQAGFISLFKGADGRPYAVLSPETKAALKKGGMDPDEFYLNVYDETGTGPNEAAQRRPGKKPAPRTAAADDLFDDAE